MPDPVILGFDTSAAHCAAALLSGGRVLAHLHEDMPRGQAERLMPLLEDVLAEGGVTWADLTRIGVGIGPGNFTGIRISVAAARGLALGLNIPAVGVNCLEAQGHGLTGPVVSTRGAGRAGLYLTAGGAPVLATLDTLPDLPGALCVGDEAGAVAARLNGRATAPAMPLAEAIARLAAMREATERPAPLYIREADAAPAKPAPPVA